MEALYRELGQLLKGHRISAGLTQKELAQKSNGQVSYTFLSQIENGYKRPSREGLQALATALDLNEGETLQLFLAADYDAPAGIEIDTSNPAIRELVVTLESILPVRAGPAPIKAVMENQVIEWVRLWRDYAEAQQALYIGDWCRAQEILKKLIEAKDAIERIPRAYILDAHGEAFYHRGQIRRAETLFSQAAISAELTNDDYIQGLNSIHLGDITRINGLWSAAREYYSQAEEKFKQLNYPPGLVWAKRNEAIVDLFQGKWNLALNHLEDIRQKFKSEDGVSEFETAKTYYALGWAYSIKGDWEKSLGYRSEGLRLAREAGDQNNIMLGYVYVNYSIKMCTVRK